MIRRLGLSCRGAFRSLTEESKIKMASTLYAASTIPWGIVTGWQLGIARSRDENRSLLTRGVFVTVFTVVGGAASYCGGALTMAAIKTNQLMEERLGLEKRKKSDTVF